jgi:hypothetical protein
LIPSFGSKERYPQRKIRHGERGGLYGFCPREKRVVSQDEVHQMRVPPFRMICNYCGGFIDRHLDKNIFG